MNSDSSYLAGVPAVEVSGSGVPAAALVTRFELAIERFHGAYADPYADAEDRGDARSNLNAARAALLAALKATGAPHAE